MIIYNTLVLKDRDRNIIVDFGIPDSSEELEDMFSLRFEVYSKKNYIDVKKYPDGREKDKYDQTNKCVYFIGKINNIIISSARLIIDEKLPTELYFKFQEPNIISKIPKKNRAELGRLITIPFKIKNRFLPRHIITLMLIKTVIDYAVANNYMGGYAFIKKKLDQKFKILNFPIHYIEQYDQVYPQEGDLYKYFNDNEDSVIPIYYLTNEIESYFKNLFSNKYFFSQDSQKIYLRNEWIYNSWLKIKYLLNYKNLTRKS